MIQKLQNLLRSLESTRNIQRMSKFLLDSIHELIPMTSSGIYLLNDRNELEALLEESMTKENREEINKHWSLRRLKNLAQGERVRILDATTQNGNQYLAVSLIAGGECVGILEGKLENSRDRANRENLEHANLFCSSAFGLIWSRFRELKHEARVQKLLAMNDFFSGFTELEDRDKMLQELVERLRTKLNFACVCVQERPAGRRFSSLINDLAEDDQKFRLPEGMAEQVHQTGFPLLAMDAASGTWGSAVQALHLKGVFIVPILLGSQSLGVLAVGSKDSSNLIAEQVAETLKGAASLCSLLFQCSRK